MRRRARFVSPLLAIGLALILAVVPALAHPGDRSPGGPVTDDPSQLSDQVGGLDGLGLANVEQTLGNQPPASVSQNKSRNVTLVGSLKLAPFNEGVHADVAGYKNLAFIGKWRGACPGTGVDIIDISNPAVPAKLSDTEDHVNTSMEDMQAVKIGNRDVLAVGLQDCLNVGLPAGKSGMELYDITNPSQPKTLSFFDVDQFGADVVGVHELHLAVNPAGRVLALLSVPDLEAITSDANGLNGTGDLLIVDITDPTHPTLAGEWGVLDEPSLGLPFYLAARSGGDARVLLHSPRPNADGTRAYLSYWDAGFIILDISDPAHPVYVGRTTYPAGAEGNAHSTAEARDGTLLVGADEDFSPFHLVFNVNSPAAIAGQYPAVEGAFTKPIVILAGKTISGDVVYVGRGCPAGSISPGSPADPYLADPSGKIALIERGACRFDNKIGRAQLAGATGVIVYNSAAGGEALVLMGGNNPVTLPDGTVVTITIPGIFVRRSTGLAMVNQISLGQTVNISASAVFDGWGYLRFFNISNPSAPVQVGSYATPHTFDESVATSGAWSVHNPEIRGSIVYASWYNDGVRVIDFSNPSLPKELGFWVGAGAPGDAPAVNIWGVAPVGNLILASDRNYGLYILKVNSAKP